MQLLASNFGRTVESATDVSNHCVHTRRLLTYVHNSNSRKSICIKVPSLAIRPYTTLSFYLDSHISMALSFISFYTLPVNHWVKHWPFFFYFFFFLLFPIWWSLLPHNPFLWRCEAGMDQMLWRQCTGQTILRHHMGQIRLTAVFHCYLQLKEEEGKYPYFLDWT